MQYVMKSGMLYDKEQKKMFARVKRDFAGQERRILSADGTVILQTDIRRLDAPPERAGDVRFLEYIMRDKNGTECAKARPDYAEEENPERAGWPVNRVPRVDHASLTMEGREYALFMRDSQSYTMEETSGRVVLRILHLGLSGGWNIEASEGIRPETICGVFAFCRYMELENEFLAV